ncbi:MAG: hypothetical protein AAGA42_10565 [Actinomycetota bacterium]
MEGAELVERRIPDQLATDGLAPALAAELDFLAGRGTPASDSGALDDGVRARAHLVAGDAATAQSLLAGLDVAALGAQGLAASAWTASRVGDPDMLRMLDAALGSGPDLLSGDGVPLGPRLRYLGVVRAARGDILDAIDVLRAAVAVGDQRAPLWGALSRADLARVVHSARAAGVLPDDAAGAAADEERRAATAARTFLAAGGYLGLSAQLEYALGRGDVVGDAATGWLSPGATWRVGFGVQPPIDITGSKGLRTLHYLVEHRERPVAAVELGLVADGDDPTAVAAALTGIDLATLVDARPAAVRGTEAESLRGMVVDDSMRTRVSKLLRRTVDRLADEHRLLGRHLAASVRTGHVCAYRPPLPTDWRTGTTSVV